MLLLAQSAASLWLVALVGLGTGVAFGAAGVAILIRRRWELPTRTLTQLAVDLAVGKWTTRSSVPESASHEVRRLAAQMDRVADAAEARFVHLNERSANLKLLVDALPDPILVSDVLDRIVLINAPAERLLQLPPQQVIGRPFVAAVNDLAILDLFEASRRHREQADSAAPPIDREIKLLRRGQRLQFQAHAELTPLGGTLLVLRDVSTLAATIQMKTDFVANASHELRTPISAIKVAFETLREVHRDEDPSLSDRCITIIDGHLRRLEEMLRDLLDLSRVENADLKPVLSPVHTGELVALLRSIWLPTAQDKRVELALPDASPGIEFQSDRRLLDLILKNLVENAIKFTPAGGRVTVMIAREGEAIRLSVADTGCGIPAEHSERVFERFYQVDAARTGGATTGRGTGLGLAIVKHAVLALGGQIQLQSKVGSGTTITCVLPQLQP